MRDLRLRPLIIKLLLHPLPLHLELQNPPFQPLNLLIILHALFLAHLQFPVLLADPFPELLSGLLKQLFLLLDISLFFLVIVLYMVV